MITVFPQKDAAATIYFSATTKRCLLDTGAYSRVAFNFVMGTHVQPRTKYLHMSVIGRRNDRSWRICSRLQFHVYKSTW